MVNMLLILTIIIQACYTQISYDYIYGLSPKEAADLVRDEFRFGYEAYIEHAFGFDDLRPIWKNGSNWSENSMMITPIDSLGTMLIMGGLQDLIDKTINELLCDGPTPKFSFIMDQGTNMFEIVIRDLGGLVSAYHFLSNEDHKSCIKALAIELGDAIYETTFNGINNVANIPDLPWIDINLATKEINKWGGLAPAGLASNIIEFGALSYIADDPKYYIAAKKTMRKLYDLRSKNTGLIGAAINIDAIDINNLTDLWPDNSAHIDAQIDSYYEYMIKCYLLFKDDECLKWWNDAMISINEYLKYEDEFGNIWFQRVDWNNGTLFGPNNPKGHNSYEYTLHAHFMSATLTLTDNENDLNLAVLNQEANQLMWDIYGITPFVYNFDTKQVIAPQYDLNPEIFESNYYLYVKTRDDIYFNRTYEYIEALLTYTKCDNDTECAGYTSIENVTNMERKNTCPSFWFAESLKFLYLTLMEKVDDNTFNFNDYIFNTEAHPVPRSWGDDALLWTESNDLSGEDIWAWINLYIFSFFTIAISFYMMILLFFTKLTKKSKYAIEFDNFENDKVDDVEWKSSYYLAFYLFFSCFCLLMSNITIVFFQTDTLIEWNYHKNSNWEILRWSYFVSVGLYFFGKIFILFAFSHSVNSKTRYLWLSRLLIILCLIILLIIQIILNDEFVVKDIIYNNDDFFSRIRGVTVDDPTDAIFCVILILLFSIVIILIYLRQFKELKSIQNATTEITNNNGHKQTDYLHRKSSIKMYLLTKDWLLLCVFVISSWAFMILWLLDLQTNVNGFFLQNTDLLISVYIVSLSYYYHERIYQTCCKYCHFGCIYCLGIPNHHKTFSSIKRISSKEKVDVRSDRPNIIPLDDYQQYGITTE